MNVSRNPVAWGLVLAGSISAVPDAFAQLEEVIVTAERREESLQKTDISMSVFTAKSLNEIGVTNYLDLADMAPNVMMHEMPGKAGGAISIRGFKNAETISSFEPKVTLYLDGVLIAKGAGSVFDVLDLERVEILRGPQGTLYGRNSVGGAVNFITKKPTDKFGGKLTVTYGSYNQQDAKGTLNVPLGDKLAVKANLATLNHDGYWRNPIYDEHLGDKNRDVAHIQVQWKPTDSATFLYSYDMTNIDETMYPLQVVAYNPAIHPELAPWIRDGSQSTRYLDRPDTFMKADIDGHSLTVNWELNNNLTLTSISGLRRFDVDNSQDSDSSPIFILNNNSGDKAETFTQEVRLVGTAWGSDLDYVVGVFYMHEDIKRIYSYLQLPNFGFTSSNLDATAKNKNWAAFGQATYALTDKLKLTLGLRYTDEHKEMTRTDSVSIPSISYESVNVFPKASKEFNDTSGMVSLTYQWTDELMTYAKVSKGYVSGGFNPRSPSSDPNLFVRGYDEETVYTYELGWKTTWFDRRLQVNGAIFYNDYKDLQVNQLTPTGDNNIDNAGDADIYGAEIEFVSRPIENLEIGGGYGYLEPEYKTYISRGVPGDPTDDVDLSNNHWAHAPENTINLYARYVIPGVLTGDLSFRVDYGWVDEYYLLTANGPNLLDGNVAPSYHFFNARVSLDDIKGPGDSTFSISLWGKNLTDETWYTSGFDLTDGLGFAAKATNPPRTFGMDLTVTF